MEKPSVTHRKDAKTTMENPPEKPFDPELAILQAAQDLIRYIADKRDAAAELEEKPSRAKRAWRSVAIMALAVRARVKQAVTATINLWITVAKEVATMAMTALHFVLHPEFNFGGG